MTGLDRDLILNRSAALRKLLVETCPEVVMAAEEFSSQVVYWPASPLGRAPVLDPATRTPCLAPGPIKPVGVTAPLLFGLNLAMKNLVLIKRKPAANGTPQSPRPAPEDADAQTGGHLSEQARRHARRADRQAPPRRGGGFAAMTLELFSTSVPAGLEPGRSGFCTVAMTRNMPRPLVEMLESLSAYRPVFLPTDPRAGDNPVAVAHLRVPVAGRTFPVLSRVCFAGQDYTSRSNRFAHHVVLEAGRPPPARRPGLAGRPARLPRNRLRRPGALAARRPAGPRRRAGLRRPARPGSG